MGDRVLYVEDNFRNRVLVKRVLMVEDYEVDEAEDGESGFTKATTEKYDLILMDINLPDVDGYEVTRRIRNADIITPIVALTANAMVGDEQKALKAGCDGYISKPVDIDQLSVSVREYIKLGRERAAVAKNGASKSSESIPKEPSDEASVQPTDAKEKSPAAAKKPLSAPPEETNTAKQEKDSAEQENSTDSAKQE